MRTDPDIIKLYQGDAVGLHRATGGENPRHAFLTVMESNTLLEGQHWRVDLTREEATILGIWLIQNAPRMPSQPGSGRTDAEVARQAAAEDQEDF